MENRLQQTGVPLPVINPRRLIIALGVLGLLWMISNSGQPVDAPSKNSPTPELIRLTANELYTAYEGNEVAADLSLKGKIIEVSGYVNSIDKSILDSMYVRLRTNDQFQSVAMGVVSSEAAKIAALQKGQFTVFRCKGMRRTIGTPFGNDCILISVR